MASLVGNHANVKIFVLYLMKNINYPLDFVSVNDIVMQTDYVMYLDFAEAFGEMLEQGLIEQSSENELGDPEYTVTERGRLVAEEFKSDLLQELLDRALSSALRYLDFKRRGILTDCRIEREPDQNFRVIFSLLEKNHEIFRTELVVDSLNRAERMRDNFNTHPDDIYRSTWSLMAGNMNFLFDKGGES